MPLLRYFGFAGSALVLLLFGLSWLFPTTTAGAYPQRNRQAGHQDQFSRAIT